MHGSHHLRYGFSVPHKNGNEPDPNGAGSFLFPNIQTEETGRQPSFQNATVTMFNRSGSNESGASLAALKCWRVPICIQR